MYTVHAAALAKLVPVTITTGPAKCVKNLAPKNMNCEWNSGWAAHNFVTSRAGGASSLAVIVLIIAAVALLASRRRRGRAQR